MISINAVMRNSEKKDPTCKECKAGWIRIADIGDSPGGLFVCECITKRRSPKVIAKLREHVADMKSRGFY